LLCSQRGLNMGKDEAYRCGLLDCMNDRPPLLATLYAADEFDAAEYYLAGMLTGAQLMFEADITVLEGAYEAGLGEI
jgi:hypothetical protein